MTGQCLAPRHAEPADAEPHSHLCAPCRRGLARDLRNLPGLHAQLELHLAPGAARGQGDGGGLPYNDPVSECRSQIRRDLTFWCQHVTELRGLDAPLVLLPGWAANPVPVMAGWLHGQVTWCSFREWAGDMAGAIADNVSQAFHLLNPRVVKRFPLPGRDGRCIEEIAEGQLCGGQVWATLYSDDDKRRPFLSCEACGKTWLGEEWLALGKRVVARRAAVAG